MNRLLRFSILPIALILLAVTVFTSPAFARNITVDGNPADWVGSSIPPINDANEPSITLEDLDISNVYYTNTTTNLFFRTDTYGTPTAWTNDNVRLLICLNTDNNTGTGKNIDQCEDTGSQNGVDYVVEINVSVGIFRVRTCNGPAAALSGCIGNTIVDFATQNNVSEIGVSFASIGITQAGCPGAGYTIPTSVYLDNATGDPDDNVLDVGEFTISVSCPLPVTLSSLTAERSDAGVKVAWATSSELNVSGYHVLRSATGSRADATRITEALIPSEGSGAAGASYSFTDAGAVVGTSYNYWVEVINTDGTPEEYGPVSAQSAPAARSFVYLPLVRR